MNTPVEAPSLLTLAWALTEHSTRHSPEAQAAATTFSDALDANIDRLPEQLIPGVAAEAQKAQKKVGEGYSTNQYSQALSRELARLGDGPPIPIRCLMLAQLITTAVITCQEYITKERIDPAIEAELLERFIAYGGYTDWNNPQRSGHAVMMKPKTPPKKPRPITPKPEITLRAALLS